MNLQPGDFVEIDGLPALVFQTSDSADVPDDHVAVWFGDPSAKRISDGGAGGVRPEVWTVPIDVCRASATPIYKH